MICLKKMVLVILVFSIGFSVNGQNIGLGTPNPSMPLHIARPSSSNLLLLDNQTTLNTDTQSGLFFRNGGFFTGGLKTIGTSTTEARLSLLTYSSNSPLINLKERLSILDDGKVGIGTINPQHALDLVGDLRNTGNVFIGNRLGLQGLLNPTSPISFPAILGKKVSLYPGATGDAGFGVFGNELRINCDYMGADITFGFDSYANGFTEKMRIKGTGFVGIGTNNPQESLHVIGDIRSSTLAGSGNRAVYADANGTLTNSIQTKYYSVSASAFVLEDGLDYAVHYEGYVYGKNDISKLRCPLFLPHGAVITGFKVYYMDNSSANNLTFSLNRQVVASGGNGNYGTASSSGSTPGILVVDVPIVSFTVNNETTTYNITVAPASGSNWTNSVDFALRNIIIRYTE